MKKKYFDLNILLDRSGSMSSVKTDMEGGLREHIEEQKKEKGVEIKVTYSLFDNVYENVFTAKDIKKIESGDLVLQPRGNTALLDALGRMINETQDRLDKLESKDQPLKVTFLVITDGEENSSTEFTIDKIKKMVEHQKNSHKWDFVFLGANIDAFSAGTSLGINTSINYNATSAGTKGLFKSLTKSRNVAYAMAATTDNYDDLLTMDFDMKLSDADVLKEEQEELKKEQEKKASATVKTK